MKIRAAVLPLLAAALSLPAIAKGPVVKKAPPVPAPKAAPDRTAFGIALGSPLALPSCPTKGDGVLTRFDVSAWAASPSTCTDPPNKGALGGMDYQVEFKPSERPSWLYGGPPRSEDDPAYFTLTVIDGNVEAIHASTDGVYVLQTVLSKLQSKYGAPALLDRSKVSTMAGGQFDTANAQWDFTDLKVFYRGTMSHVTSGVVMIETPKASAASTAATEARHGAERQL